MRTGLLRHRITLQTRTQAVDAYGGPLPDGWEDYVTVWAFVESMTGKEFFASSQMQTTVTRRIRMRYREDIEPEMRVKHGKDVFNIIAVLPANNKRELVLMCREYSYEQETA